MPHDPRRIERVKSFRHMLQNEHLGLIRNAWYGFAIAEIKRAKTDIAAVCRPALQESLLPMVPTTLRQRVSPFRPGWQTASIPNRPRKHSIIRPLVSVMSVPSSLPAHEPKETPSVATSPSSQRTFPGAETVADCAAHNASQAAFAWRLPWPRDNALGNDFLE